MKKILMGLGIVFASLLVIAVIGVGLLSYFGRDLDKESKIYVDQTIPVIANTWNPQELIDRASPELLQAAPPEKIERLFQSFSERLGPLKQYKGSRGEAKLFFSPQGKTTTAAYVADGDFEKGSAEMRIRTILRTGEWRIIEFAVFSPQLVP